MVRYSMIMSMLMLSANSLHAAGFFKCACGNEVTEIETHATTITVAPAPQKKPIPLSFKLPQTPRPHTRLLVSPISPYPGLASSTKSPMDITPRSAMDTDSVASAITPTSEIPLQIPTPNAPRTFYRSLPQGSFRPITHVEELVAQQAVMVHRESFDETRIITYSPQAHNEFEQRRRTHATQFAQAFKEQRPAMQKHKKAIQEENRQLRHDRRNFATTIITNCLQACKEDGVTFPHTIRYRATDPDSNPIEKTITITQWQYDALREIPPKLPNIPLANEVVDQILEIVPNSENLDLKEFNFSMEYRVYKNHATSSSYVITLNTERLELFEQTIIEPPLHRTLTDQQVAAIIQEVSVKTKSPGKKVHARNGRSLKEEMLRKSPIDRELLQAKINGYEDQNNGTPPSLAQFAALISSDTF